jgi:UDP-N-acetylglucosamine transferase subunit ALG13
MSRLVPVLADVPSRFPHLHPFEAQLGTTPTPPGWKTRGVVSMHELAELMALADVVVTHGGPATVSQARTAGTIPIVVPRQQRFGEHVDDHQVLYARRLAVMDEIILVEDVSELLATIERYHELQALLPPPVTLDTRPAVYAFARVADRLLSS